MWQCDDCGLIIQGGCDPDEHTCDEITLYWATVRRELDADLDDLLGEAA